MSIDHSTSRAIKWLAAGALAVCALGSAAVANANGVRWSVGVAAPGVVVGVGQPGYGYYQPAPAYIAPPQAYYAPPPPVYYRPAAPVYYAPPPPVYYGPPPYYRYRHHHHGWR